MPDSTSCSMLSRINENKNLVLQHESIRKINVIKILIKC